MNRANQDSNPASSSGLGDNSGVSDNTGSRRGSLFITLTPKLKKILGISSNSLSLHQATDEHEPRSQSACSGCFSSNAMDSSSSGSATSLHSRATKAAEKVAKKKREKEAKMFEKNRKKLEKIEQKRFKAEKRRASSLSDQLPSDLEIREYFFSYKNILNKPPVTRPYSAAQVRAAAASFEAATACSSSIEAVAGPSSRPHSRLLDDNERIYTGSPRGSRPSSRLNYYLRNPDEDEERGASIISTKFTSFERD